MNKLKKSMQFLESNRIKSVLFYGTGHPIYEPDRYYVIVTDFGNRVLLVYFNTEKEFVEFRKCDEPFNIIYELEKITHRDPGSGIGWDCDGNGIDNESAMYTFIDILTQSKH